MSNKYQAVVVLQPCQFVLGFNEATPQTVESATSISGCVMREANQGYKLLSILGSCYAEASIDYETKKINFELHHLNVDDSFKDPYDDMFGFQSGLNSLIQYKIEGNLETSVLKMTTRIQCKTHDNCALDKLVKLIPDLIIYDGREKFFNQIKEILNTDAPRTNPLTCVNELNEDIKCSQNDDRCIHINTKLKSVKACGVTPSGKYDIEYRFNEVQELEDGVHKNSEAALKSIYYCNNDRCNSEEINKKVDKLLYSLAMVPKSLTILNDPDTNDNNQSGPVPNPDSHSGSNARSADACLLVSFYSQLIIIIFSFFIQLLSN